MRCGGEVTITPDAYPDFFLVYLGLKTGGEVETDAVMVPVPEGSVLISAPRRSIRSAILPPHSGRTAVNPRTSTPLSSTLRFTSPMAWSAVSFRGTLPADGRDEAWAGTRGRECRQLKPAEYTHWSITRVGPSACSQRRPADCATEDRAGSQHPHAPEPSRCSGYAAARQPDIRHVVTRQADDARGLHQLVSQAGQGRGG